VVEQRGTIAADYTVAREAAGAFYERLRQLFAERNGMPIAAANGHSRAVSVFSPTIDEVVREAPCDIAVVKQRGTTEVHRILVPVRGGPHAELALRFADALARQHGARVVALQLVPPGVTASVRSQAERALGHVLKQHVQGHADVLVKEATNVRNTILREAEQADLVIMGASAAPSTSGGETYTADAAPGGAGRWSRRPSADAVADVRVGPDHDVAGRLVARWTWSGGCTATGTWRDSRG